MHTDTPAMGRQFFTATSLLALTFASLAGCAPDNVGDVTEWTIEERAFPVPPADIDSPVVWHFLDETVAPEVEFSFDVWGEDSYRVPLKFESELPRIDREMRESERLRHLSDGPTFIGFREPFFDDGRIHMFEKGRNPNVYKFGRLEIGSSGSGLGGQVVYPPSFGKRTEPYPRESGEDLPDGLAEWFESGQWPISAYVFKPGRQFWVEYHLVPLDCADDPIGGCYVNSEIRDLGDPRLLWLGALNNFEIYR